MIGYRGPGLRFLFRWRPVDSVCFLLLAEAVVTALAGKECRYGKYAQPGHYDMVDALATLMTAEFSFYFLQYLHFAFFLIFHNIVCF